MVKGKLLHRAMAFLNQILRKPSRAEKNRWHYIKRCYWESMCAKDSENSWRSLNASFIHTDSIIYRSLYIYIYIYIYTLMAFACMHTYIHKYIHANIHTCKHAYIHTPIHQYINTSIHQYITHVHDAYTSPCTHTKNNVWTSLTKFNIRKRLWSRSPKGIDMISCSHLRNEFTELIAKHRPGRQTGFLEAEPRLDIYSQFNIR